ncbi:hypothetical protein RJ639_011642 [Escallonia herrerae]|uniref:F-box domain-containing protein n=1 Tax=Escallonia herrerae TaxID=1293975 RepID=A0AA88VNB3_9ASTE|nr:hypothetical protein RJ639_011642 [Escallonia herrerae]
MERINIGMAGSGRGRKSREVVNLGSTMKQFSSTSSLHKDLYMEILQRLDAKSLTRFKLVSKQWYKFLSDPSFATVYFVKRPSITGFFYQTSGKYEEKIQYVPIERTQEPVSDPTQCLGFLDEAAILRNSCNGLLHWASSRYMHFVSNPLTNKFIAFRFPYDDVTFFACGIAFDPTVSDELQVILIVGHPGLGVLRLCSFASETQNWCVEKETLVSANHKQPHCPYRGVFFNGVLYWELMDNVLLACDASDHSTSIVKLPAVDSLSGAKPGCLGCSNGRLQYCRVLKDMFLRVWVARQCGMTNSTSWVFEYKVKVCELMPEKPAMMPPLDEVQPLGFLDGCDGILVAVRDAINAYSVKDGAVKKSLRAVNAFRVILPKLDAMSVARYELVSKEWYEFLSDPSFTDLFFSERPSITGFFYQTSRHYPEKIQYVAIDPHQEHVSYPTSCLGFLDNPAILHNSCNGLLHWSSSRYNHFISNPLTNKVVAVEIEYHNRPNMFFACGIAFDPNTSDNFEVIVLMGHPGLDVLRSKSFASETLKWGMERKTLVPRNQAAPYCPYRGVFLNGSLYWELRSNVLLAYDVRDQSASLIKLPDDIDISDENNLGLDQPGCLGGSGGKLHYCRIIMAMILYVWVEMEDNSANWVRRFSVNICDSMRRNPSMLLPCYLSEALSFVYGCEWVLVGVRGSVVALRLKDGAIKITGLIPGLYDFTSAAETTAAKTSLMIDISMVDEWLTLAGLPSGAVKLCSGDVDGLYPGQGLFDIFLHYKKNEIHQILASYHPEAGKPLAVKEKIRVIPQHCNGFFTELIFGH